MRVGGAFVHELHAQTKPPVYAISEIEVSDPATYARYQAINIPLVHKLGARYWFAVAWLLPIERAPLILCRRIRSRRVEVARPQGPAQPL